MSNSLINYHASLLLQIKLHSYKQLFQVTGKYRGVPVGCMAPEGSKTRQGVLQTKAAIQADLQQVLAVVVVRADDTITYLHSGLMEVYTGEEDIFIKHVTQLLDLKSISEVVVRYGAANVATTRYRRWLDSARFLNQDLFAHISAEELRAQFRLFMRKMEELAPGLGELANTDIFSLLLHPSLGHYRGMEFVLGLMANASTSMGLESVVESWVSVMEHHNNVRRPLTQERLEQETMIALNGPEEFHCDSVVKEAVASHWRKLKQKGSRDGHWIRYSGCVSSILNHHIIFHRRSSNIKSYLVSKAIDTLVNQEPSLPFMV